MAHDPALIKLRRLHVGEVQLQARQLQVDLTTLKAKGRRQRRLKPLWEYGYRHCFGLGEDETLLGLAR